MLKEVLFTKIEEEDITNIWFQQDGATCHIVEAILDILRFVFEDCSINIGENRTHTLKSQSTKTESLFGADFGPGA